MEITIIIRKFLLINILVILTIGNFTPSVGIGIISLDGSFSSPSNIDFLESQITILNADDDEFLNGLNLFGLIQTQSEDPSSVRNSYLAITNMDGKIVTSPLHDDEGRSFSEIMWINDTTILTNYKNQPIFWNVITNVTQQFNFAEGHYDDLKYNPDSKRFMILEQFLNEIANSTGDLEEMIVARVSEYSLQGEKLRHWDLSDYVNSSIYFDNFDRLNPPVNKTIITTTFNATSNTTITTSLNITLNATLEKFNFEGASYIDPIHANRIYWDIENRFIYVNLRNLNQFIKFDYENNELEWVAGQNSDFKILKANGSETESLWYYSHDLNYLGNDEFLMFDNDHHNLTDPMGNFTQSSIVKFKVDTINMTLKETFRWLGSKSYSGETEGGAQQLSNGNYLATFGAAVHGNQSSPSHESFGGAAVEINPSGDKVWELRVPFRSGFSKLQRYIPVITASPALTVTVDVGTEIELIWDNIFSNFPKSYNISIGTNNDLESGDWNSEDISYTLDTSDLTQGQHIVTLTLTDMAENTKSISTKITILLPPTSKKDKTSFMTLVFLNTMLIAYFINKKRSVKSF